MSNYVPPSAIPTPTLTSTSTSIRTHAVPLALVLLSLGLLLLGLGVSVGSTGFDHLWQTLGAAQTDPDGTAMARQIVWDIRLPRALGAWLAGALLALAGAIAQGVFRNPLADPYLLGSASGASLGVALTVVALSGLAPHLGNGLVVTVLSSQWLVRLGLTGGAFVGAVLAVLLTLALSRGVQHTVRLLLSGVVVGVVLGALTQLVMLAFPESLQTMQGFMLGSTAFVGWSSCALMALVWLLCAVAGWAGARVLDGLSLGDATAHSLGLPVAPLRLALVLVLALATGTAVAQTGLIAFVGLGAPHLVRSLVKTRHGPLLWLASLMGGVLLLIADTLARWLIAPQELPVGVLTAVLGGGYLLLLIKAKQ